MDDLHELWTTSAVTIGGHESPVGQSDEWLTPRDIIANLGPFDLDPCTPVEQPYPTAARRFTKNDLMPIWDDDDFVWLNPPYSSIGIWMAQLAVHPGGGIALVFARTETRWFVTTVWQQATSVAFLHGRVDFTPLDGLFVGKRGNAGAPSVLVAYGEKAHERLERLHRPATLLRIPRPKRQTVTSVSIGQSSLDHLPPEEPQ